MRWARLWAIGGLIFALGATGCAVRAQAARPVTYVAIGASDAVGVGAKDPITEGWVPRLGARLGPEARVINLGVSGSTLAPALDERLRPALHAPPDNGTGGAGGDDPSARDSLSKQAPAV